MKRLHTVLSLLALPAEQQIQLLPEIPYDRGAPDYYTALDRNPMLLLVRGVVEDYSQPESESDADYITRTGLQPRCPCAALNELCCFIYLLRHHYDADNYWTQRALTGKDEWRLVRRLASLALAEANWETSCSKQDIHDAIEGYQRELIQA